MAGQPSLSPRRSQRLSADLAERFFAIVWAGENSSRSFFLPLFRETLRVWGMLGV
jgi:hypothetical protein